MNELAPKSNMAPVLIKVVVRFSSEDLINGKVENLLRSQVDPSAGRWMCSKEDTGERLEAEFQLDRASYINHIDIGNYGTAFIEVFVGNSMWPPGKDFLSLLPSAMLMMPGDCKQWRQTTSVRMFHEESFNKRALKEKWDCVRVICRQPFRKDKQFGLSFIRFGTKDNEVASPKSSVEDKTGSVLGSSSPPTPIEKINLLSPRLKTPMRNKVDSLESPGSLTRGSKMLQAALDSKSKKSKKINCSRDDSFPDDDDDIKCQNTRVVNKIIRKRSNSEDIEIFEAKMTRNQESPKLNENSWIVNEDIEDEVKCFLSGIDFTSIDLDTVTYSDLRQKMEAQRGCRLNKYEKKTFLKMARDAVAHAMEHQYNNEQGPSQVAYSRLSQDEQGKEVSKDSKVIKKANPKRQRLRYEIDDDITDSVQSTTRLDDNMECSTNVITSSSSSNDTTNTVHQKEERITECPICGEMFSSLVVEGHASTCTNFSNGPHQSDNKNNTKLLVECPICSRHFPTESVTEHANYCAETSGRYEDNPEEVIAL